MRTLEELSAYEELRRMLTAKEAVAKALDHAAFWIEAVSRLDADASRAHFAASSKWLVYATARVAVEAMWPALRTPLPETIRAAPREGSGKKRRARPEDVSG